MRLERERPDGRRDFWEATRTRATIEIKSGVVNVKHKNETKKFDTAKDARAALEELVAAKRARGYGDPIATGSQVLPTKMPRNAALERAIREDKTDPGACGVYADWLQAQDSPAGEWVALAAALEKRSAVKQQERFDVLSEQLALPKPDLATWGTRHGFFQWLRLENSKDWMDETFDPLLLANKLFATPLCAALDELRIGVLRWDHNNKDVPAVVDAAGAHDWAKALARLHLGDVDKNIDMAHHMIGEVGGVITLAFPRLRWLKLHSGSQEWRGTGETFGLAGLALPKLETLIVETCAMTPERLEAILRAKLPALTHLELWFGGSDHDAGATLDDLAPLLDGKVFPKVKHLGLCNLEFTNDLADRLVESPIAARLVHLDLSKGTFDGSNLANFYANHDRFAKLETLDVSDNFLTKRDLEEIRACFKANVISTGQPKTEYDEDGRFASVRE